MIEIFNSSNNLPNNGRTTSFKNHIESSSDRKSNNYFCEKDNLRASLGIKSEKPWNALLDSAIRAKSRAPVKKTKQTGAMLGDYLSRTIVRFSIVRRLCMIFEWIDTLPQVLRDQLGSQNVCIVLQIINNASRSKWRYLSLVGKIENMQKLYCKKERRINTNYTTNNR